MSKYIHIAFALALAAYELCLMWQFRDSLTIYAVSHDWMQWAALVSLGSWRFAAKVDLTIL